MPDPSAPDPVLFAVERRATTLTTGFRQAFFVPVTAASRSPAAIFSFAMDRTLAQAHRGIQ